MVLVVKNLHANTGDKGDECSIPGSGRCPGGEHGNPLQYSCQENPMDRGTWQAAIHGVAELDTIEVTEVTEQAMLPRARNCGLDICKPTNIHLMYLQRIFVN